MSGKSKIPLRKCASCGEQFEKNALVRVVRSPEGEVSVDTTGKKNGRGVYLCKNPECLNKAKKARKLERALECAVTQSVYDELDALISHT